MQLPEVERFAMWKLLPSMLCQKRIEENRMNWLDPESVYNTVLVAYDDVERAEHAELQSLRAIVNHECKR